MSRVFNGVSVVPFAPNIWGVHCRLAGGQEYAYPVGTLQKAEHEAAQLRATHLVGVCFDEKTTQPN